MATRVLFNTAAAKPALVLVNLDLVKNIQNGAVTGTVSLDGLIVKGDVMQVTLMSEHMIYPGVATGAITAG